jgi:signal transduction histidine kinase
MQPTWTLLIADDCQEDREVYREYLSSDPSHLYQFIEAGSAEAGLALCQKRQYDAILLDFRLPDMTGLEFLDVLQQGSPAPLPVIMLTGQGDERVAVQAMKQGVQDYLIKQDLDPDVLQVTVRNVIQRFHSQVRSHKHRRRQKQLFLGQHLGQSSVPTQSRSKNSISQSSSQNSQNSIVSLQPAAGQRNLLQLLESEKRLNAIQSQLMTIISYEYRASIGTILAAASTLKLQGHQLQVSKQERFLHLIEEKARQMAQLVEDLLVIETFESGKSSLVPLPFEILQFISGLLEEQRQVTGNSHELTFRITGNTKGFWGSQQMLRLMFVNLLSNAMKYSSQGSTVDVHLHGNASSIVIEVKDQGIGILPGEDAQIFQAFARGSNVEGIPGKGVGLAIAKACVELQGGEISVTSEIGNGTQFTICLPKQSAMDLELLQDSVGEVQHANR